MIPIPALVLVTAPVAGRVDRTVADGVDVAAGDVVATVDRGGSRVDVRTPRAGRVAGALVALRGVVDKGDGVVWLDRA